jgi:hypothetical protein
MEDMKQHLQKQIAIHERDAAAYDLAAVQHQQQIAHVRAMAGQSRAFADECRRLLEMYEPVVEEAQPEPVVEEVADQGPTYEAVARNPSEWGGHPGAEEQLRVCMLLGAEYDSADKAKRAGRSRWQYVVARAREMDDAKANASAEVEMPKYVWLTEAEATQQQKLMALSKAGDRYAVSVDDLTEAQRPAYTSDAADFGGLPG